MRPSQARSGTVRLLDFSTVRGGGDRELQPWPESSPAPHPTAYLGSPFPGPTAQSPLGFRGILDGRTFLPRGRTQLSLGQQLPILLGGQPGGRSLPWSPGTGLAPCSCQCYAQALGQARRDSQTGGMGVREGDETGAGQPWGRGADPWLLLLDPSSLSQYLPLQPSRLLSGSSSSVSGANPLAGPNSLSAVRPPAACLLPARCQSLGTPSRPTARPGSHKGAIELRTLDPAA